MFPGKHAEEAAGKLVSYNTNNSYLFCYLYYSTNTISCAFFRVLNIHFVRPYDRQLPTSWRQKTVIQPVTESAFTLVQLNLELKKKMATIIQSERRDRSNSLTMKIKVSHHKSVSDTERC